MRVIGTAGHVDHGKSTLIAALTGTHPDRLKEEREREMTIDLGFGWMDLPKVGPVGIIDVPGHRDFIENMLAGVGGIDAALLVVAADEGVMPQTREHLSILDLLEIPATLIVLTKTDLASEEEWLDLVEADIRRLAAGTAIENAPCVRVSAKTGAGLEMLRESLAELLLQESDRPDLGRPRLPIDRVFTMAGFGTVVTGTLSDGRLTLGDEVEILPSGNRARIRGLQTHKKQESVAAPGSRTAVNLAGIEKAALARGDVVTHPGTYAGSRRLDARFRLLKDASAPLLHGVQVKCFLGASESPCRVRLLGQEELAPGEEAFIQLEPSRQLVAVRGDHFILRQPSPGETLGGGRILDPAPVGRHKRFSEAVLRSLENLAQASPATLVLQAALSSGASSLHEIVARCGLPAETAMAVVPELIANGQLVALGDGAPAEEQIVIAMAHWNELRNRAKGLLETYHREFPLRRGIPREELKSRLELSSRIFAGVVERLGEEGLLAVSGEVVFGPDHQVVFDEAQEAGIQALLKVFADHPHSPPTAEHCRTMVGGEVLRALIASRVLVAVSPDVLYRVQDYDAMVRTIRRVLEEKSHVTMAEVRDLFQTSRKYVQPLLEHLDSEGVTVREGDVRRLKN